MSEHETLNDGHGTGVATEARPSAPTAGRARRIFVTVLIVITTLLGVVAIFSVWANRLLFNPHNWSKTSTQLLQNEEIRGATANYLLDQTYANVDVAARLKADLPPQLQGLAVPAAGALRSAAVKGVELALSRPFVQNLWAKANYAADQAFVSIVKGGKGAVAVDQGVVTLDLASIVDNVATRLGLPSDISSKLPPSIAHLQVLKSNQLKLVQNVGNGIRGLALVLTILVPVLYLLTIALARGYRRRMLMRVGFAIVFAGVIGLLGRSLLESQITNSLAQDDAARPAIRATIGIGTAMINEIGGAFIFVGLFAIAAAWFAGPARVAVEGRRAIAPYMRENPVGAFGAVAAVMALIFIWDPIPATGTPVGMLVFLALALWGAEMLHRQVVREFPDTQAGAATAAIRARVRTTRERRQRPSAQTGSALSVPEQLERLASLRADGAITGEEYEAAKAELLHV